MTTKQEAISITKNYLKDKQYYQEFAVDEDNIEEKDTLWYIPFYDPNPKPNELLAGAGNGLIVDKASTDIFQPGSALQLEEWIYGFEIGLRGKRYDLIIEKVNDWRTALDILAKLELTYVKIEIEGGTEWKVPRNFSRKEIKKRLYKLPCTFKNQGFTYSINTFRQIRNERMLEYKLLKTENTNPKILGELIED